MKISINNSLMFQNLKNKVKDFFGTFDLFTNPINLRFNGQPDHDTFTGGFVSVLMLCIFIGVFFTSWMSLISKENIKASENTQRENDPSNIEISSDQFMIAFGVPGLNITSSDPKYFDINFDVYYRSPDGNFLAIPIGLNPCTLDQWKHFGDSFQSIFKKNSLQTFFCLPANKTFRFVGKWTSSQFYMIRIRVQKCASNCKTQAQFDAYINTRNGFFFNIFYSNKLLNPQQSDPVTYYLQDKDFFIITDKLGNQVNLYLSEYQIATDESVFPFEDTQIKKGIFIDRTQHEQFNFIPKSSDGLYSQFHFRKSDKKISITRSFTKIDEMLSYMGGLFGIVTMIIGILFIYYNRFSLELSLSEKIFEYKDQSAESNQNIMQSSQQKQNTGDSKQQSIKINNFNFFYYLLFLVYLGLKKIGIRFNWTRMKMYDQTLQEMNHQLDVNLLLQKIVFYDKVVRVLFDEEQLKLLYLQEKFNIKEIRQQRQLHDIHVAILNLVQDNENQNTDLQLVKNLAFSPGKTSFAEISYPNQVQDIQKKKKAIRNRASIISINNFQFLNKKQQLNSSSIPDEIKTALQKIKNKMEYGDNVSQRIYEGLQPSLIQKFEQSIKKAAQEDIQKEYEQKQIIIKKSKQRKPLIMQLDQFC